MDNDQNNPVEETGAVPPVDTTEVTTSTAALVSELSSELPTVDAPPEDKSDDVAPEVSPYYQGVAPNTVEMPNVWLIKPDTTSDADMWDYSFRLAVLPSNLRGWNHFTQNVQVGQASVDAAGIAKWDETIRLATKSVVPQELSDAVGCLDYAAERPGAHWTTSVAAGTQRVFAAQPQISARKTAESGGLLTGSLAVQRVTGLMHNLGQSLSVPMWRSGFWLTLKAPTLQDWIELDNRVAFEKTELARQTRGMSLSNQTVFANGHVLDFILKHVYDCSIVNWTPEIIRELLELQDFQALATYMAATVYPNGFPLSVPCTVDISKCMHTTRELVNLTKLVWTDSNQLSARQKEFMAARRERRSVAQIISYKEEFPVPASSILKLNDSVSIEFTTPTMERHLNQGYEWIQSLIAATDSAFGQEWTGNRREAYLQRQAKASEVKSYAHWFKRISTSDIVNDEEFIEHIEDDETISTLCAQFSSDVELVDRIEAAVMRYINDTMTSIVAVPNFKCPKCDQYHMTQDGPNKHLLPIDAISYFFIVLRRRIMESRTR